MENALLLDLMIRYPDAPGDAREDVKGDVDNPVRGLATLRGHVDFIPLVPGDVVRVQGQEIVGVEVLLPVYSYEIQFKLPVGLTAGKPLEPWSSAVVKIGALIREWQRAAWVDQHTKLTARVTAQDEEWLSSTVLVHPFVEDARLVRDPDFRIAFSTAVRNCDWDGSGGGPWV